MTDKELTLIREAAFSSPELSSNTQGCRHGRLYQDLDHHVPDCSIWAIEATVSTAPIPTGSPSSRSRKDGSSVVWTCPTHSFPGGG